MSPAALPAGKGSAVIDPSQFRRTAALGLLELIASLLQAVRGGGRPFLIRRAWGPLPWLTLGLAAVAAVFGGVLVGGLIPNFSWLRSSVWPGLLLALPIAARTRSTLRRRNPEVPAAPAAGLRAPALPVAFAVLVLVATVHGAPFVRPAAWPGAVSELSAEGTFGLTQALRLMLSTLAHGVKRASESPGPAPSVPDRCQAHLSLSRRRGRGAGSGFESARGAWSRSRDIPAPQARTLPLPEA